MKLWNTLQRWFGRSPFATADKGEWELEWQRTMWAPLFRQPASQAKVHEYWCKFRHLDEILARVPLHPESYVLDVGCGLSTVLHFLPGHRFGIDPLGDEYTRIYEYPQGIDVRSGFAESLPFSDGTFDLVTCSNVIDHTVQPVQAMHEMQRVLRPGGHLVLTCEVFPQDVGERGAGHPHSLTVARLEELVAEFEPVAHWESPWIGLRRYVLGKPPRAQREHIWLVRRAA